MTSSYLPVAVRAYTQWGEPKERKPHPWTLPDYVIVLDAETTTDARQRLTFLSYRFLPITRHGEKLRSSCLEEGLVYDDELPAADQEGYALLSSYTAHRAADVVPGVNARLRLLTRSEFVNTVLYPAAYRARAGIVAFNLPFDISRLAVDVRRGRDHYEGGFSFALCQYRDTRGAWRENKYRPRFALKNIDSKRALKGFTVPRDIDPVDLVPLDSPEGESKFAAFGGNFLDLRQLVFALTDKGHSLESSCAAFGVNYVKRKVQHGKITTEYIAYNREDVQATAELYVKIIEEYLKHPIDLDPTQAYSPATIGRAYLRAMGIRPVLERQPEFSKSVLGYAMGSYYGGWTECRIRRVPVPVVCMDFLSQYPTVCTLMQLERFLTCERVDVEDATGDVRDLLSRITLEDCLHSEPWRRLSGLVQIVPDGDILPCRAPYGGKQWQIGVNPIKFEEPIWYTIPDVMASVLRTGKVPRILRAISFVSEGKNPTLSPIALRGTAQVDPRSQQFFKTVIEERKRAHSGRDPEEHDRLDRFLKVLASATSYGIFVEMRRHELPEDKKERVSVYGLEDEPFDAEIRAPETPGEFTFPPIGTLISGAGRLMLAILERLVKDAGGVFAFCDTDSMAVVATERGGLVPCPGGPKRLADGHEAIQALSWHQVERIRERFSQLNPYDPTAVPGSILKLEDLNFDRGSGQRRQLYCYAISSKRYALFLLDEHGRPELRDYLEDGRTEPLKLSEHGLGHLLNPSNPEDEDRDWITVIWEGIITEALGAPYCWPQWLGQPAASRLTVSTWNQLELFAAVNRGKVYGDRIKPANFLLSFHVAPFGHPTGVDPERFHLFAPWNPDSRQWLKLVCVDRYSKRTFRITTAGPTGSEGVARVKTYGDVLDEYRVHPEPKSLGPDRRPCHRSTIGLLHRRAVTGIYLEYVGKESNRIEDVRAGIVHGLDEVMTIIPHPDRVAWRKLVLPVLREVPVADLVRESGRSAAMIKRIRAGGLPTAKFAANLVRVAGEFARRRLEAWNQSTPIDDYALCYAYLRTRSLFLRSLADPEVEKEGVSVPEKTVKVANKPYKVKMAYSGRVPDRRLYQVAGHAEGPEGEHIDIAVAFTGAWAAANPGTGKTDEERAASFRKQAEKTSLKYIETAIQTSHEKVRVIVDADRSIKIEKIG